MRRAGLPEFDRADSAWNLAAAGGEQPDPFCARTEWQFSFQETFCAGRPTVLATDDAGSLIGFGEHTDAALGPLLVPLEAHWLFGCPLQGPRALDLLLELLAGPWPGNRPPGVVVSGLLPGGPLQRAVVRAFADRGPIARLEPMVLRCASLAGGRDGFLGRRSTRFRRNLRTSLRRAADRGVAFERCRPRTEAAAAAAYARMLAVEARSWKGIDHCGMAEPPVCAFYAALLRRLAQAGSARAVFARADDQDVGFAFGGIAGDVFRGQQFSFADDWRALGIGNLLQWELLGWLAEDGVQRYDMGPDMAYKRHWTEQERVAEALLVRAA